MQGGPENSAGSQADKTIISRVKDNEVIVAAGMISVTLAVVAYIAKSNRRMSICASISLLGDDTPTIWSHEHALTPIFDSRYSY